MSTDPPAARPDPATLLRAASFAAEQHKNQQRKDVAKTPYINHPLGVAAVLADVGGVTDEALLIAALLHDVVEDTDLGPDGIEEHFGAEVRALVQEVTDDKSLPKLERKRRQIEHAPLASARARQLKIADKICNLRDITASPPAGWSLARQHDYLDWASAVVDGCRGVNARLEASFDAALAAAHTRVTASEADESS